MAATGSFGRAGLLAAAIGVVVLADASSATGATITYTTVGILQRSGDSLGLDGAGFRLDFAIDAGAVPTQFATLPDGTRTLYSDLVAGTLTLAGSEADDGVLSFTTRLTVVDQLGAGPSAACRMLSADCLRFDTFTLVMSQGFLTVSAVFALPAGVLQGSGPHPPPVPGIAPALSSFEDHTASAYEVAPAFSTVPAPPAALLVPIALAALPAWARRRGPLSPRRGP